MVLKFHTRKLILFSTKTRKEVLFKLTLRCYNSLMRERINLSLKKEIEDIAITCKYQNEVIAWSLIYNKNKIMVYVHPKYRKKGIGKKLLLRCQSYLKKNKEEKCLVAPWNNVSDSFYNKINFKYKKGYSTFCMEKKL